MKLPRGATKLSQGYDKTVQGGATKMSYNNTIIYNTINNTIKIREGRALHFLFENNREQFDLILKDAKNVKDIQKLCDDFEDTADQEELKFSALVISGRL